MSHSFSLWRMYPDYQLFGLQTAFRGMAIFGSFWISSGTRLIVKDAKVNFDLQLEKLKKSIPAADHYNFTAFIPQ